MSERRVYEATADSLAREAVIARLYARAEFWCMEELRLAGLGKHIEAEGAHQMALGVMRAYDAECRDPEPRR